MYELLELMGAAGNNITSTVTVLSRESVPGELVLTDKKCVSAIYTPNCKYNN